MQKGLDVSSEGMVPLEAIAGYQEPTEFTALMGSAGLAPRVAQRGRQIRQVFV